MQVDSFFDVWRSTATRPSTTPTTSASSTPPTRGITIDGYFDPDEWAPCHARRATTPTTTPAGTRPTEPEMNELYGLYVDLGRGLPLSRPSTVRCRATAGCSTSTPTRASRQRRDRPHRDRRVGAGTTFTASGFAADFQYGCYQHQGAFDSDSFFSIDSATTTTDLTDSIISAFDSQHDYGIDGGSEMAIPWDVLYGLGPDAGPARTREISLVASICWDPEPGRRTRRRLRSRRTARRRCRCSTRSTRSRSTTTVTGCRTREPREPDDGGRGRRARGCSTEPPQPVQPGDDDLVRRGRERRRRRAARGLRPAGARSRPSLTGRSSPATHAVVWDGRTRRPASLASGVYFARLTVGDDTDVGEDDHAEVTRRVRGCRRRAIRGAQGPAATRAAAVTWAARPRRATRRETGPARPFPTLTPHARTAYIGEETRLESRCLTEERHGKRHGRRSDRHRRIPLQAHRHFRGCGDAADGEDSASPHRRRGGRPATAPATRSRCSPRSSGRRTAISTTTRSACSTTCSTSYV